MTLDKLDAVIREAIEWQKQLLLARKHREWGDVADALDELSHARGILVEVNESLAKVPAEVITKKES